MPSPIRGETVAKALRRRAQLQRWSRQTPSLSASPTTGANIPSSSPLSSSTAVAPSSSSFPSAAPQVRVSSRAGSLVASQTLQHAYRHRDTAQPTPLQRRLVDFLSSSSTKPAEAQEAFDLVCRSDQEALSPATFAAFSSVMLRHKVTAQMGGVAAYEAALADSIGVKEGCWSTTDSSELRAFALYQACRLERYALKGTSFQEQLGLTLEGADNALVTLTLHQLRKHATRALPVPCDVLSELLHLDLSWRTALQVYDYAKELTPVDPPADMTVRLMGLMTGYKTNGLGSRPWAQAIELYDALLKSGYEVPLEAHTAALDAVWRRGDTFAKPHQSPSKEEADEMWGTLVRVRESVTEADITGDAGCRFSEALVKAASAAGRWEAAVQVLQGMDVTVKETTHRLLLPTAETFLFAMAACNTAGHAAHAASLLQAYDAQFTFRSAHPEALCTYLHSLRHVEHLSTTVGEQVEALVTDGQGLDRPCAMACLQLLSSRRVRTKAEKWRLAQQLWAAFDANPWQQQPQMRQRELQTVFRCCHLIAAAAGGGKHQLRACPLMREIRGQLSAIFGASSPECQWLEDTEIYSLLTTRRWEDAVQVYQRQVEQRPAERMADLPIPVRQARQMLAQALLRHARAARGEEDEFLLEDDVGEATKADVHRLLAYFVKTTRGVYAGAADTIPRAVIGELLLLQALQTDTSASRQRLALEALRELVQGDASAVSPRIIDLVSQALSLTVEHVQGVLVEGGAQLRGKALQGEKSRRVRAHGVLEQVLL